MSMRPSPNKHLQAPFGLWGSGLPIAVSPSRLLEQGRHDLNPRKGRPWRGLTRSPGSPIFFANGLAMIDSESDFTATRVTPRGTGSIPGYGEVARWLPGGYRLHPASSSTVLTCQANDAEVRSETDTGSPGKEVRTCTPYEELSLLSMGPFRQGRQKLVDSPTDCFAPVIALRPVMNNTLTTRLVTFLDRLII